MSLVNRHALKPLGFELEAAQHPGNRPAHGVEGSAEVAA